MKDLTGFDPQNKKVLLRVDFDVPLEKSNLKNQILRIGEAFRIRKQKEMIGWLLEKGARVIMVGHIEAINSFKELTPQLEELLGHKINFLVDFQAKNEFLANRTDQLALLENIRQWSEEKNNDAHFAQDLAAGLDVYVNNAFAVCHRNHASIAAITQHLPSYAGLLVQQEVSALKKAIDMPLSGKVIIMGGAKAETKVPVIKNFLDKAEYILVGGVVANDILKERGQDIGKSRVDENTKELLAGVDVHDSRIVVPDDFVISDEKFLDIGPRSLERFIAIIRNARTIIWNGPLGMFEDQRFAVGTKAVAKAIVDSEAKGIIGGGDTIAAVDPMGLLGQFDFVSTGGGAMLAFLSGEQLPGLKALGYYD